MHKQYIPFRKKNLVKLCAQALLYNGICIAIFIHVHLFRLQLHSSTPVHRMVVVFFFVLQLSRQNGAVRCCLVCCGKWHEPWELDVDTNFCSHTYDMCVYSVYSAHSGRYYTVLYPIVNTSLLWGTHTASKASMMTQNVCVHMRFCSHKTHTVHTHIHKWWTNKNKYPKHKYIHLPHQIVLLLVIRNNRKHCYFCT